MAIVAPAAGLCHTEPDGAGHRRHRHGCASGVAKPAVRADRSWLPITTGSPAQDVRVLPRVERRRPHGDCRGAMRKDLDGRTGPTMTKYVSPDAQGSPDQKTVRRP